MKASKIIIGTVALVSLFLTSCASNQVSRVDANTQIDLSGYWNDTDVRIVCETLIAESLSSNGIEQFRASKNTNPVFIVGAFRNNSDEHIDTSIITKRMETAIINSGKAEFVASSSERGEIRTERDQQQSFSSEATAKTLGNETGADFMLIGSVKTIVDRAADGKTATRTYFVYAELINVETNRKIWIGENSSIKKVIKTASAKF